VQTERTGRTWKAVRQAFLTGFIALLPVVVTIYVAYRIVQFFDGVSLLLQIRHPIPGLGIVITLIFITLFGLLVQNILGQQFVKLIEWIFGRIPFVESFYNGVKQILATFFGTSDERRFKSVVLVPYPDPVSRAMGFVVNDDVAEGRVGVLIPFSPPTGGYLLFFRPESVEPSDLSVDEAMKLLLSGGMLVPQGPAALPKEAEVVKE